MVRRTLDINGIVGTIKASLNCISSSSPGSLYPCIDAHHGQQVSSSKMSASDTLVPTPLPFSEGSAISDLEQNVEKELVVLGAVPESLTSAPIVDPEAERKLLWKLDCHVVPPLFVLFLLAFLDRVNIGNANIQGLSAELNLEKHQYNIALFIFFIPYVRVPNFNVIQY